MSEKPEALSDAHEPVRNDSWRAGRRNGVKWAVEYLHGQAKSMNDPHATQVLNAAAFHLGTDAKSSITDASLADTQRASFVRGEMGNIEADRSETRLTRPKVDTSKDAVAKRLERLGSLAERGWIDGDVVDLVHALSAERDQLAARLAEARDAAGDGHASDCATHNEPAMPNGPCDCGASSAITMREAAAKVAETEALWRPQWDGQPSYYAIAATIRSLPLPPDTRDGEIAELRAMNKLLHAANAAFAENMTTVSGDGEPTKADMCATISALRSAVAQQRLGSQRGQVVAATAAFQPLVTK